MGAAGLKPGSESHEAALTLRYSAGLPDLGTSTEILKPV
jgi:hypothetical protein